VNVRFTEYEVKLPDDNRSYVVRKAGSVIEEYRASWSLDEVLAATERSVREEWGVDACIVLSRHEDESGSSYGFHIIEEE
jgi:hypothetical protein